MNSKEELIKSCERILWIEKEINRKYASYQNHLSDENLLKSLKEIEDDEARHINMAERILSILRK